jgi:hypothetical protein
MRSHHNSNFQRTCICHCRSFNVTNPKASDTFAEFNAPLTSCLLANIKIAASASDYVGETLAISKALPKASMFHKPINFSYLAFNHLMQLPLGDM